MIFRHKREKMDRIGVLFVSLLMVTTSFAQFRSGFGTISEKDALLKECEFEPDAAAVVLFEEGSSDYTDEYGLMTFYHVRMKVLKEAGKDFANVSIVYRSSDQAEYIDQLEAMVINFDENGSKRGTTLVDKNSIYTKKVSENYSQITFAFPDVKVGSILEYRYRINSRSYWYLRDWYFQSTIPVYKSAFLMKSPPTREISYFVQRDPRLNITIKPQKETNSIFFEMNNIPGFVDEPYMDARQDYIQKVIFQTTKRIGMTGLDNIFSTWTEVAKQLNARDDFGSQLRVNIDACDDFIKTIAGLTPLEKMKRVHAFVASSVGWNGNRSLVTDQGIRQMWKKRSGNSAEINLLLVSLCEKAGLEAYPILISERSNGRINQAMPFIEQFNNVYAVVFAGDKKYYLNATDKNTSPLLTPYEILNTTGFITNNKRGGLTHIEDTDTRFRDFISIDARLEEDGTLRGSVQIQSRDYARYIHLKEYRESGRDKYVQQHLLHNLQNISVENLRIDNENNDSLPLKHAFSFESSLQRTGDYSFLSLNLFSGFERNPFILKERFSSVNFGFRQSNTFGMIVRLPASYTVDQLPKNIKVKNADGTVTFSRDLFHDTASHQLVSRIKVEIDKSVFAADEYQALQQFFKKITDLMNEQIVLKKS